MKLKKLFITGLLIAAFATTVSAQSYKTGVGARLGYDSGITLKNFFTPASAFEGILSFSPRYFNLTGLYEYQQKLQGAPGLDWYVGLGAHVGGMHHKKDYEGNSFWVGLDLIGGLEYVFPTAPFTISLDWKPAFNFAGSYNDYWYSSLALSLRYTFR